MPFDKQIKAAVKSLKTWRNIKGAYYETGVDQTGDPSVWLWMIVSDDAPASFWKYPSISKVARSVEAALAKKGVPLLPYVYFKTKSELEEESSGDSMNNY